MRPEKLRDSTLAGPQHPLRLAYLVSHPIQYQAPLLRRIAAEPDIDLTVFFGSDFSLRGYRDAGFGVEVAWDTPLTEGYRHAFLPKLRDTGGVSPFAPISHGVLRALSGHDGTSAFDALWVHGYASANALHGIASANALGIPVLLRAESWLQDRHRRASKLWVKQQSMRALRRAITATLPIGSHNRDYWAHYFGEDFPQFLMPYAVDNEFFAARTEAARQDLPALRASLQMEFGRPVVLFASKLQERKHCDHLLDAFAHFTGARNADAPKPYLVIVGDGEQRHALEAQAESLGLKDVRFAGFQNQSGLPGFFALADVFVLPSRHEPWGLIVNEAMAAGVAVICSEDVGSQRDLISTGVQGVVYPTGDVPALAAALHTVLDEPGTAARMGRAAAARMQNWSFQEDIAGLRAALRFATRRLRT